MAQQIPPQVVQAMLQQQQQGPPPERVFVSFSANIVPDTASVLIATMTGLANKKVPEVHLLLSTPGGDVMSGVTIYNMLRGVPYKLITHNVGNVDSIGNAIFLAGQERYACASATFMFHGVGFNAPQNARFEEKLLRERLDGLMMNQERIAAIIEDRTDLTAEQIAPLFLEAQTKNCDWALQHGVIHEVREVNLPEGGPIQSLVFQRQGVVGA